MFYAHAEAGESQAIELHTRREDLRQPIAFWPAVVANVPAVLLKEQEEKLRAKYGGMIPKKNLIVSDKKHFDSADWSRSRQLGVVSSAGGDGAEFCDDEEILKPVLGAKDVPGTSPPSDASTFTTTNTSSKTKRRTSMDESRGRWDMNATTNTTVNSAYHAPAGASSGGK